jgi:hypothetical protein
MNEADELMNEMVEPRHLRRKSGAKRFFLLSSLDLGILPSFLIYYTGLAN